MKVRENIPEINLSPEHKIEKASNFIKLNPDVQEILSQSMNEICINFPVLLDCGKLEIFEGFRVQHNNELGPYAGGIRIHPSVSIENMRIFSKWMTYRAALLEIPFGGSAGGIKLNPRSYSRTELERIIRRFTFSLGENIAPDYDIICPDINSNAQVMAWILDTYLYSIPPQRRNCSIHLVTGKPVELGGIPGNEKAYAEAIVHVIKSWATREKINLDGTTYILQGFGNVGYWSAVLLEELGCKLIALENSSGAIYNQKGIDPNNTKVFIEEHKSLKKFLKAHHVSHKEFLSTKADFFIPAALENQINAETCKWLNVKAVFEGATGPTTMDAEKILSEKRIEVFPDLLCNSGGTIISYFEWLQNKRSESWSLGEVEERLKRKIIATFKKVAAIVDEYNLDWRTAAYTVALKRLENVYLNRGIFP